MNSQFDRLPGTFFKTKIGDLNIKQKLGKGKSGFSFLAESYDKKVVLKLMHNEPCPYYDFGNTNKVQLETDAYGQLQKCGILIPELLTYDLEENYLVKEYIEGDVAVNLIANNQITESVIEKLFEMFYKTKKENINIDYFPANFVISNNSVYYIDYECNIYDPQWDLLNWGIYYWANSEGFSNYLSSGDILSINESAESGIPLKRPVQNKVSTWKSKYLSN